MVQSLNMYNDQFETCALCFKIYFCENCCVNPFKKNLNQCLNMNISKALCEY